MAPRTSPTAVAAHALESSCGPAPKMNSVYDKIITRMVADDTRSRQVSPMASTSRGVGATTAATKSALKCHPRIVRGWYGRLTSRAPTSDGEPSMATATRIVTYSDQETALTGFLAWDDAARHPLPGLLLVHGGAGLDDHAKGQAQRYAAHGYAVLACDMFGDGVAGHRERVMACLVALRDDPQRLSRRAAAGLAGPAACAAGAGSRS